jgi:glycosyltransferase involved in cell wall biosynthesis
MEPNGPIAPNVHSVERSLERAFSILMLAPCPFPTGQGTQVVIRHLASGLVRAGHAVHLVTYGYGDSETELPFHVHRSPRVDVGRRSGPSLLKPAADAALLLTALRVARTYRCDLVHAHNVEGLGLGALVKLQTGRPLVYHAHNAMGPELPTYFEAPAAQAFASLVGDVLDRTLPRAANAVIVFDSDHKALHEVYGVASERLHVIPPGLDGEELHEPELSVRDRVASELGHGPWVLYAGNPDAYQNLPLLWSAMMLVRQQLPRARLVVATHHDPALFQPSIDVAGVSGIVRVYRYRHLEELRALFHLADVGVCPRILWTGAPIKILNYLATGLPVVACRSGARHLVSAAAGELVDDSPEAFAQGILAVLARRRQGGRPRGRAQRRAFERFRIEGHIPLYERVYAQVLERHAKLVSRANGEL